MKTLAAQASLSTRQLTRLFQSELGTTPARYVEMVRIDAARAALDAGRSVTDTARLAGFGSAETLRRVFVDYLGVSPKAYRDRFRTVTGKAEYRSENVAKCCWASSVVGTRIATCLPSWTALNAARTAISVLP